MSDVEVSELDSRQVGTAQNLTATAEVALSRATPDRLIDVSLTAGWRPTTGESMDGDST
ncbi:hypothetical protein [Microbacterium laevaniformans]|uniref:hypothetical protein n=1 Tax=Microbacterium laevaniformans TaxID=36807 RepID=UPI0031F16158